MRQSTASDRNPAAANASVDGKSKPSTFWRELYSFFVICVAAWIAAMVVLPSRMEEHSQVLEVERELAREVGDLRERERVLEAGIVAMENDPFYQEEVYRYILGVKKKGEEFLKKPAADFR